MAIKYVPSKPYKAIASNIVMSSTAIAVQALRSQRAPSGELCAERAYIAIASKVVCHN